MRSHELTLAGRELQSLDQLARFEFDGQRIFPIACGHDMHFACRHLRLPAYYASKRTMSEAHPQDRVTPEPPWP
jgi:hypothetical protein